MLAVCLVLVALLLAGLVGREVLAWVGDDEPAASAVAVAATPIPAAVATGLVVAYLPLQVLSLLGVRWGPVVLTGLLAGLLVLAARGARRGWAGGGGRRWAQGQRWGAGDLVALLALSTFALFARAGWATTPDYVYHWGVKAARFALADGIDWGFLAAAQNWAVHPDYPNLLPSLGSLLLRALGEQDAGAAAFVTACLHALIVLGVRDVLAARLASRFFVQAGVALAAVVISALGLGSFLGGGADALPALALIAAVPLLLGSPRRAAAWRLGWLAAFAAAGKVEGVVMAGLLLAVFGVRAVWAGWASFAARGAEGSVEPARWRTLWRRLDPAGLALLAVPLLAVGLPWWLGIQRFGLLQALDRGGFDPANVPLVQAAVLRVLEVRAYYGFGWLVIALPLALVALRGLRPALLVASGQLAFYLWVYLASRVDTTFWVLSSLPRLLFHLLPVALVAAVVTLAKLAGEADDGQRGRGEAPAGPR